ncbi:MAG: hypothetical protein KDB16_10855, partial [Acidimicrobiales bacterium]|nr:hypothetical protein [Acidimicrobiales bacterium]
EDLREVASPVGLDPVGFDARGALGLRRLGGSLTLGARCGTRRQRCAALVGGGSYSLHSLAQFAHRATPVLTGN